MDPAQFETFLNQFKALQGQLVASLRGLEQLRVLTIGWRVTMRARPSHASLRIKVVTTTILLKVTMIM